MPRFKILTIFLAAVLTMTAQVRLQTPSKVSANTTFSVTITLDDPNGRIATTPEIPNCKYVGSGVMTRITTQVIGGKQTKQQAKDVTLTYLARDKGTVTIPPIKVELSNGKTVTTQAKQINIIDGPTSAYDRTRPADIDDVDQMMATPNFSANDVFVRIVTDKSAVYEQEPVVATIKLYSRLSMGAKFQLLTQPTFEGFLSEELQVQSPQSVETFDGKEYNTFVVKRCVLYPQKAGDLKVTSGTYEITLEDMASYNTGLLLPDQRLFRKTVRTQDKTASLKVLPLPEPRPVSFDGAVGVFNVTADLSTEVPHTNEPMTYTLRISGKGNIKYLKTPKLNLPDGLDQYTPKTDIDARVVGGDIAGTYTATYTIVPQEVGSFGIPPLDFTYFDPSDKQYHTIALHGYNFKVAKGSDAPEAAPTTKKMTDIHHIHLASKPLQKSIDRVYFTWWYHALYALLVVSFVAMVIAYRRRIRLNADVQGRKLARAMRVAMKRFKNARSLMQQHKADAFYAEISKALFGYLSDKLAIPASQLVRDNIAAQLGEYGLSDSEAANVIAIIDDCEMARFTPMGSDAEMSQIYDKVLQAVKSIENVKQPRKPQQA